MEDILKVMVTKSHVESRLGTKISRRDWLWIKRATRSDIQEIMIDKIEILAEQLALSL